MKISFVAAAFFFALGTARADDFFPAAEGTTWQYEFTEEFGGPAAAPAVRSIATVRLGTQSFDGKAFRKLETFSGSVLSKTELATIDERGLLCHARAGKDGKIAKLNPPQLIVPATLKVGDSWDSQGQVADLEMHQHFTVAAEESVMVPAGRFRAFRLHCEDASLMSVVLDRWFVPGTGFVKETTVVRGPTGGLVQRTTLQLQKPPEIIAKPEPTPASVVAESEKAPQVILKPESTPAHTATVAELSEAPVDEKPSAAPVRKLIGEVSGDAAGGSKREFKSDVANIYVRWHAHGLREGARVRVAWIAEDVGDLVEPNFVVDETETTAPAPESSARFTLGRPPDGWAEGKYRLEFYIDGILEETLQVTIHP